MTYHYSGVVFITGVQVCSFVEKNGFSVKIREKSKNASKISSVNRFAVFLISSVEK